MNKLFLTHIVFRHLGGLRYEWIRMIMFHALDTTGKATDEWVGRFYEIGTAVVTAGGIGMLEGWWDIPGG